MFLVNSRLDLFTAAPARSEREAHHAPGHPFSRSYGVILPSSLTWFLSRTSGFSPCPPVSVCGTDASSSSLRSFSWQQSVSRSVPPVGGTSRHVSGCGPADFPLRSPYTLGLPLPSGSRPGILRPSIARMKQYRTINLLSIGYAFRPRLRFRLTLGGRALPRNPWTFGGRDSHPPCRYSCLHGHLCAVHRAFRYGFDPHTALSYHILPSGRTSAASVPDLVPIIFGAEPLDQ